MAIFPLQVFTTGTALLGFSDEYRSSLLGQKYAGMPKGVYVGMVAPFAPGGSVATFSPDPAEGYSVIKLPSQVDPAGVDVVLTDPVSLDFAGQPNGDFPIDVVMRASYTDDPDTPTTAEIFTRVQGPVAFNEVLIARISGPAGAITIGTDPNANNRDAPLAFVGTDFGFMPAGSIEDLQAAADAVAEVVAARVGLDGTVHPSLSDRLAEDMSADSMAGRLALVFRVLRSNDVDIAAGEDNVNVSGSFSQINRQYPPAITLGGDGSETTVGAVAEPTDSVRNVCMVTDAATGYRPIDDPTDRRIVFGRLDGPTEVTVSGEWTFENAQDDVTGTDGQAQTELQVGDTIQGPDGLFYEIETVNSNTSITLTSAYTGATATSGNLIARRWLLRLKRMDGSTEEDASFPTPKTLRFFFPAFLTMGQSNADWSMILHSTAEREPLAAATTDIPGTTTLAAVGSLLGAVNIQNGGVGLGGGPFHTINFNAPNASVVPGAVSSEVEVVEIGLQGPTGPPGASGGTGPAGPVGPGYSSINTFERSGELSGNPGSSTPVPHTFTRDMGLNIRTLAVGIAQFSDDGGFAFPNDVMELTSVSLVNPTTAQVDLTIAQDTQTFVFFSAAGD